MRAMMSLRLDRFFGAWMREFSPDYTPGETGMDRFIAWTKTTDFIGRAAAQAERANGAARHLVAFEVDAQDADVNGDEPVWIGGEVCGVCTSGGYSHHAGKSVALALIPAACAREGLQAEIEILGDRRPARLVTEPLLDPERARMRGWRTTPGVAPVASLGVEYLGKDEEAQCWRSSGSLWPTPRKTRLSGRIQMTPSSRKTASSSRPGNPS